MNGRLLSRNHIILASLVLLITGSASASEVAESFKLITNQPDAGDEFGCAVAAAEDSLVVGARYDWVGSISSGLAYVFVKSGETWTGAPALASTTPADGERFGSSVSISGERLLLGGPRDSDFGTLAGSVTAFSQVNGTWTLSQTLSPTDANDYDRFGFRVALDGTYAIVTSPGDDDTYNYSGSAYVFFNNGTSWSQQTKLHASDPAASDEFGYSCSMSGDYAVVSTRQDDESRGSAYVYMRTGTSWDFQQKIMATTRTAGDQFGNSVCLRDNYVAIGAPGTASDTGAVYVFERTGTSWTQTAELTAYGGSSGDRFGESVALDESRLVVGCPGCDDGEGAALLFEYTGSAWLEISKLIASDSPLSGALGTSVAIEESLIAVGAAGYASGVGAVYVYNIEEIDCNDNGVPDACDIDCAATNPLTQENCYIDFPAPTNCGQADDCNTNGIPDDCEPDCNSNGFADSCDIANGFSNDCDSNGIPDDCEDCNNNGIGDACEVAAGSAVDCNGNGVPDECEMPDDEVLLQTSFTQGMPDGWSATGLWHVTSACERDTPCESSKWAYFGQDQSCNFDAGSVLGVLSAPLLSVPSSAGKVTLTFCSIYNGESGVSPSGYDAAWVTVNEVLVDDISGTAPLEEWQTRRVDLTSFAGQDVLVSWHFRSHDEGTNDTLGWQIDSIKLVSGAETNNDCNGNGVLDSCDIAEGTSDDCNSNGIPDTCDISEGTSTDCNDNLIPDDCESQQDCNTNGILDICEKLILRVDEAVVGGNEDGSSWENAITDLQTALTLAGSECISVEIWAANGVYEPADIGGDRSESFALQSNVAIYGGFAGNDSAIYSGGETKLKQRDILSNPTILSGDLNGDDVDTTGLEENSYRVVVGNGTTASAILDGVTISAGNANGPDNSGYTDDYDRGAAIYIYSGNPTIRNCVITGNSSEAGAVYMRECDSAISNCDITDNTGDWSGGMYILAGSAATITSCTVSNNTSATYGGAVFASGGCAPTFINCVFSKNSTVNNGGAIYAQNSTTNVRMVNCTLSDNQALGLGGGISLGVNGRLTVVNSVLWQNSDSVGTESASQIHVASGNATVTFSVIQDDDPEDSSIPFGGAENDNLDDDPLFADDVLDDLRLSSGSPCIDSGKNNPVADTTMPTTDRDGLPRFLDDASTADSGLGTAPIIDRGAYEFQIDCNNNEIPDAQEIASGSADDCDDNGIIDECEVVARDCNENTKIDACDIEEGDSVDCNDNGTPDECEITSTAPYGTFFCIADCDPDCNTNGVPDECDIAGETSTDCNNSGVPDECKPDCNTNGVPDPCENYTQVLRQSGNLSPLHYGVSHSLSLVGLPTALSDVTISFTAVGNLSSQVEYVSVDLNSLDIGDAFRPWTGNDCPLVSLDSMVLASGYFNALVQNGMANFTIYPSQYVDNVCTQGSYIRLQLTYDTDGDCNNNGTLDSCEISRASCSDFNTNGMCDECEDCNNNGLPDDCDLSCGSTSSLCNQAGCGLEMDADSNGVLDICEDCNTNGIPDTQEISAGSASDVNGNGVPDECEDCNANGTPDDLDISQAVSDDCNNNALPDECEISAETPGGNYYCINDCDPDCNTNGIPDECDISGTTSADCNTNSVPDECDTSPDCNTNGIPDECDIALHVSDDCNTNGVPDECDLLAVGGSHDCDSNEIPDECQTDSDTDGVIDDCDECPDTLPGVPVATNGCSLMRGGCCFAFAPCLVTDYDTCSALTGAYLGGGTTCATDSDDDGYTDCDDVCPDDPLKWATAGDCGCGVEDVHSDGDDVADCIDLCPLTAPATPVDEDGCPLSGACCTATSICFAEGMSEAACTIYPGAAYQGNGSFCADGCAIGTTPGDFDGDEDVDLDDYIHFAECLDDSGPREAQSWVPPSPQCRETFDFDGDADIDLEDCAAFQEAFTG